MMVDKNKRVCPIKRAGGLDNRVRRLLQNPQKILGNYVKEGMTALDLGCGPGFFSVEMAIMVGESGLVIATDLQEGMLQKLKNKIHIKTKWESSYCRTKTISRFKGGV